MSERISYENKYRYEKKNHSSSKLLIGKTSVNGMTSKNGTFNPIRTSAITT